jgi:hypothetical protein
LGRLKEGKKMEKKGMDKLIGKHCKIVTKEPGDDTAHVVFAQVALIDYNSGFMIIESERGTGCLNMKTIEAIKPNPKKH